MLNGSSPLALALVAASLCLASCDDTSDSPPSTPSSDDDAQTSGESVTLSPTGPSDTAADGGPGPDMTSADATGGTTPMPTSGDPTVGDADSGDATGQGFIDEEETGGVAPECDVWTDDCPRGEKCMPWADDGSTVWNSTRCSPLADTPAAPGEQCSIMESATAGLDNCDSRALCYYIDSDTDEGICTPFCDGSPEAPVCDPGSICTIANDGVLTLCRPECDPLLQDCAGSASCLPATGGDGFTCITDASGASGAFGDPCQSVNSCDPGLYCSNADNVPDCNSARCCTFFCDLGEGMCDHPEQECITWFADPPPGTEHVGACVIPD